MKSSAQFIDICTLWAAKKKYENKFLYTASRYMPYLYIFIFSDCTVRFTTRSERQRINLTIVSANLLALTWLHFLFAVRLLACHTVYNVRSNFPILWLRESKFRNKQKNYYKWLLLITTQDTNRIKFCLRSKNVCLWLADIIVARAFSPFVII